MQEPIAPYFVCTVCHYAHSWEELCAANELTLTGAKCNENDLIFLCGDCKSLYDPKGKCSLCQKNPTQRYKIHLHDSDDDFGVDWFYPIGSSDGHAVRTMCKKWPKCATPLPRMRLRLLRAGFWYWVETNAMCAEGRRIKRARRGHIEDPLSGIRQM